MDYLKQFTRLYLDIILGLVFFLFCIFFNNLGSNALATIFSILSVVSFAITVSKIADILAFRMKEPYSSFVLTFSAIAIEIILLSIFLYEGFHTQNPEAIEIVKAGIIAAVIVDINFLLGLSVLMGGLSFKEQSHNEETSSTYTTVLLASAIILLVPSVVEYVNNDFGMLYSASVAISILLLMFYMGIFIFQTRTHSHFFANTGKSRIFLINKRQKKNEAEEHTKEATSGIEKEATYVFEKINNFWNIVIIVGFLCLVAVLSEIFSHNSLIIFNEYGISIGLAALSIAIISVAPEIFTSIKAARNDEIQRAVNIGMGASTVSILLAIPIIMFIAYLIGIDFTLDFNKFHLAALIASIILAWKTTEDGETNYFEGISHLVLFLAFIIMIVF